MDVMGRIPGTAAGFLLRLLEVTGSLQDRQGKHPLQ